MIGAIDRRRPGIGVDGEESDDRKEELLEGPYLGAPGLCDRKWNVRGGEEEVGLDVTHKHTRIARRVQSQVNTHTHTHHFLPNGQCWRDGQLPSRSCLCEFSFISSISQLLVSLPSLSSYFTASALFRQNKWNGRDTKGKHNHRYSIIVNIEPREAVWLTRLTR